MREKESVRANSSATNKFNDLNLIFIIQMEQATGLILKQHTERKNNEKGMGIKRKKTKEPDKTR